MNLRYPLRALAALLLALLGSAAPTLAQQCAIAQGSASTQLPKDSATLPDFMTTAGNSSYLYVATQWGMARGSLSNRANPSNFTIVQIGKEAGYDNGGVIPVLCDCHTGFNMMDAAEAPDGSARVLSDFDPAHKGTRGSPAGLLGQVTRADGAGIMTYGQQINFSYVSTSAKPAAIYLPSAQKFFGYVPVGTGTSLSIAVVDLTSTSGSPFNPPLSSSFTLSWAASVLKAGSVPGHALLAGATSGDQKLRIAEINATTGIPAETAIVSTPGYPKALYIAAVNGRVFIFSAEGEDPLAVDGNPGGFLRVYEYNPATFSLSLAGAIAGDYNNVVVKGGQFPAIFAHRTATFSPSYTTFVDIYDTKFLTQGGNPRLAYSLPHGGSGFRKDALEAVVDNSIAYVYRLKTLVPPATEHSVYTDKLDISCIAADLTAAPVASANAVNLSIAERASDGRADSANYFGDRWQLTDQSATGSPLDTIQWDFNVPGGQPPLVFDETDPISSGSPVTGYFPCEPITASANIRSGSNCYFSFGSPTATSNYYFGMHTHNVAPANKWSNDFISSAFAVAVPRAKVAALDTSVNPPVLRVLSGSGQADAKISQGNLREATITWSLFPQPNQSGTPTVQSDLNLTNVAVPSSAQSFKLDVLYKAGNISSVLGSIVQVDLVPDFSLSPSTVINGGQLTLTNLMQKGASTTLNSTTYTINSTPPLSGTVATGNWTTAMVTAPSSAGTYAIQLTYNFTGPGGPQSLSVGPRSFSTSAFVPTPLPIVYLDAHSQLAPGFGFFNLTTGTTYFIYDDETLPNGITHPGAKFYFSNDNNPSVSAGDVSLGTSTGFGPVTWTPSTVCSTCYVKASVPASSGSVRAIRISVSNYVPPPPPPPPPSSVTVSLSGPPSGVTGTAVSFTATAFGASGSVSYTWNWGDNAFSFVVGPATNSHVYSTPGTYTVIVQATAANGSATASASIAIAPGGPPSPSGAFTVAGAEANPFTGSYTAEASKTVTFTAVESNASSYAWNFGDGVFGSGKTATHAYASAGARTATLTVTGDGTQTSGTASSSANFTITPPSFRGVILPGAAHLDDGTTTWGTDVSITNTGTSASTVSMAFVPFLNEAAASLDLTQLVYTSPITLAPGSSWSMNDIVSFLQGGNNKGTVVFKYEGASRPPLVEGRVYFAPKVNPNNISYGSAIPTYDVDGSGQVVAQGAIASPAASGAQTASATALASDSLTVTKTGGGSGTVSSDPPGIDCGATCSASFDTGSTVILSAAAGAGSVFSGWSGCTNEVLGQCAVTMNGSKTVSARFETSAPPPPPSGNLALSVSKAGSGSGTVSSAPAGIDCGVTCTAQFAPGTAVTLTASPAAGSTFDGWAGACSGAGSCLVTLTAPQSVTATFSGSAAAPASDQVLIGLRSNELYRFGVTLFNASGSTGTFRLAAADEDGASILIQDPTGALVAYQDFVVRPFQQAYLKNDDLGLTDPNKRYVFKASKTSGTGTLLAFGSALDRKTNDLVQITDDSQASIAESGLVSYWVAAVSRFDSGSGARWRTDLRLFNRGQQARNLYFEYYFSSSAGPEQTARVNQVRIAPGQLLTYDDVVGSLLDQDTSVDLKSVSSAGVLRIYYAADADSASRPLMIGSRNYDDQPTGTAGSQLAVYTRVHSVTPGQKLYLTGVEDSARYASRIGVFTFDSGPATGRIVVVAPDGSEAGSVAFTLGGGSGRFGQISLTDPGMNFRNPGAPVTIRVESASGSRLGAYAFTVDKVTLDTNFIQGIPQN